MGQPLLCGMDFEQWQRAIEWAQADLNIHDIAGAVISGDGHEKFDELLNVWRAWLEAGGPLSDMIARRAPYVGRG